MKSNILRAILIVIFFIIFFNILIADILHTQACTTTSPPNSKLSCEEEAIMQAKNCKYVFLFWQKVEPSQKDIDACIKYRER